MNLTSEQLPQADKLESVVQVVLAVNKGKTTDEQIADSVQGIRGDSRQGRYYRKAAEILGLIANQRNSAKMTAKGKEFIRNPTLTNPLLISSVLNLRISQRLFPVLEEHRGGLSKEEIVRHIGAFGRHILSVATIERRVSTILSWLLSLNVVNHVTSKYKLSNTFMSRMSAIEIEDITEPLLPATGGLKDYTTAKGRISNATGVIKQYLDLAKRDRANRSHVKLVETVADRIKSFGAYPKSNGFIDLAVSIGARSFIFEMKSTTGSNERGQLRKAISQLYEYRYLENIPHAQLVVVIENQISNDLSWMIDYLETDRGMYCIWDGGGRLFSTPKAKAELSFLKLS